MGTVWECLWEYLYLDTMEVKLYPYWLTPSEAGHIRVLVEFDGGRKLLHTRRERVGPAAWLEACKVEPYSVKPLPEFDSPIRSELVALYRRERDPDVRRPILEIVRARRVMGDIEDCGRPSLACVVLAKCDYLVSGVTFRAGFGRNGQQCLPTLGHSKHRVHTLFQVVNKIVILLYIKEF